MAKVCLRIFNFSSTLVCRSKHAIQMKIIRTTKEKASRSQANLSALPAQLFSRDFGSGRISADASLPSLAKKFNWKSWHGRGLQEISWKSSVNIRSRNFRPWTACDRLVSEVILLDSNQSMLVRWSKKFHCFESEFFSKIEQTLDSIRSILAWRLQHVSNLVHKVQNRLRHRWSEMQLKFRRIISRTSIEISRRYLGDYAQLNSSTPWTLSRPLLAHLAEARERDSNLTVQSLAAHHSPRIFNERSGVYPHRC